MVTLYMNAMDFGISAPEVKAHYNTLEEAMTQAQHNIDTGKQRPIRICDEAGQVLWVPES